MVDMVKLDLLIKGYNNNLAVMRDYWLAFLDATSSNDEFINKSTFHRDIPEGRAADSLWFIMSNEYDKVRAKYKEEWWELYNKYCSFKIAVETSNIPTSYVGKNPVEERMEYFTHTFAFFEKWINILKEKTVQHSIIVKSTLHTLDMALLTKG